MAKKPKNTEAPQQVKKDEELFRTIGKNKKKKRRKIIISVVSILVILGLLATIGVTVLRRRVREQFAGSHGEVLSYEVSTGSISTVVSGSGSLIDVDLSAVTVPQGVEINEILVKANDTVTTGDVLATVNMASVVSAMADLQNQIQTLDDEISSAEGDEADTSVTAGVAGRVKAIYGTVDADVADLMYEKGALAILSLDGYMAMDIVADVLSVGDSVILKTDESTELTGTVDTVVNGVATILVTDEDTELTGTVDTVVNGVATILVTDEDTELGQVVTVWDSNGTELASGTLYIHSPLSITGFAGTIAEVKTESDAEVEATTILFTLEDTGYSANYQSLLRSRGELEKTLLELLTIQRDGAVLATMNGSVYSVDYSENSTSVVTLSPNEKMSVTISISESDILSLAPGQTVTVTVSSVSEDAFDGTLVEIDRTNSSGSYSAVIELDKVEGMLSGMTARVSIRIEGVDKSYGERYFFGRNEAAGVTYGISAGSWEDPRVVALVESIACTASGTDNVDPPWYWEGEPFFSTTMSQMVGTYTLTADFIPIYQPMVTFETFEHDIVVVGEMVYILSDTVLSQYSYDGGNLTFLKEIPLDDEYDMLEKGAEGEIILSAFMRPVIGHNGETQTFSYEGPEQFTVAPGGQWGISWFVNGDECMLYSFRDGTLAGSDFPFPEVDIIRNINIDSNYILVSGSSVVDEEHYLFVYDYSGELQMQLNGDPNGFGLGSITYAVSTANGFLALDGNMREINLWTADGTWIGSVDDGDLFGTHYPWIASADMDDDGSILVIMCEERQDKSADEVIVFKLTGF